MKWDYQVARNKFGELEIFDVYYDNDGSPIATHVNPTTVWSETVDGLKWQMELKLEALALPILEEYDIGRNQL